MNVRRKKKDENKNPKTQALCKQNEWHFQIFLKHYKPSGLSEQQHLQLVHSVEHIMPSQWALLYYDYVA